MNAKLMLIFIIASRRMTAGEALEDILRDYPKLSGAEQALLADRLS